MSLYLKPLRDATKQLEEALSLHKDASAKGDPILQKHMRAAAIQAFEFTYEITFKALKRHLGDVSSSPQTVDTMTFADVIREAFGQDLVCSDVAVWRKYRRNRTITSHTYNEDRAQEVFECVSDFLADAQYTLSKLEKEQPNDKSD